MAILVDLIVLNLFAEHWHRVHIDGFSVSLIAAVLLQLLLQATLVAEHRVALVFEKREGALGSFLRFFSAWLILFASKFVMLGVIDRVFGDSVHFLGPMHGAGAFIAVVVAMLGAEELITRVYQRLA